MADLARRGAPGWRDVTRRGAAWLGLALVPYLALVGLAAFRGPWTAHLGGFLIAYAAAWVVCVAAAHAPLGGREIVLGAVIFRALLLPLAPSLSDDVYRDVWEGRVANAGFDPYVLPPAAPALAALRDADWTRINHPEYTAIYPPLAQLVFRSLAACGGVMLFKAAFALADVGLVVLLVRALAERGARLAPAVLYAWNPLAVVEVAASGHFEPLGVLPLVAAVLWGARRPVRSGLALAASLAAKYAALVALPFVARRSLRLAVACLLGVAACFALHMRSGLHLFDSLRLYAEHWRFNDLAFSFVQRWIEGPRAARGVAAALLVACGTLAWWRGGRVEAQVRTVLAAALVLSPTVHPWYLLWPLAFVPLAPSPALVVWSGTIGLAYLFAYPGFGFGPVPKESWLLKWIEMLPVLLAGLWSLRRRASSS